MSSHSAASHRKSKASRPADSRLSTHNPEKPTSSRGSSLKADPPGTRDKPQPDVVNNPETAEDADEIEEQGQEVEEQEDDDDENEEEDDDGYRSVDVDNSLLPPPFFDPLFTLITDSQTPDTHHPSVYYVFSDDAENEREGNDVATIASLTALRDRNELDDREADTDDSETEERFILVDLEPSVDDDGMAVKVKKISSLSPEWAVSSAILRTAPTLDDEGQQDGNLMLKIDGIELKGQTLSHKQNIKGVKTIKERAEHGAADLLETARKQGGGNIIEGMSEIYRNLSLGLGVIDKISNEAEVEEIQA